MFGFERSRGGPIEIKFRKRGSESPGRRFGAGVLKLCLASAPTVGPTPPIPAGGRANETRPRFSQAKGLNWNRSSIVRPDRASPLSFAARFALRIAIRLENVFI